MPSPNKSNKEACSSRTRSKVPNVCKSRSGMEGQFWGVQSVLMKQEVHNSGNDLVFSPKDFKEFGGIPSKIPDTDSGFSGTSGSSVVPERKDKPRVKYIFGATNDFSSKSQVSIDSSSIFHEEVQSVASIDDFKSSTENATSAHGNCSSEASFRRTNPTKSGQVLSSSHKIIQDSGKVSIISLLNVESLSTDSRESSPGS